MADAEPVLVNTIPDKNFEPDFDDLKSKINSSIKGVIINSPSNPTGAGYSKKEINDLAKF